MSVNANTLTNTLTPDAPMLCAVRCLNVALTAPLAERLPSDDFSIPELNLQASLPEEAKILVIDDEPVNIKIIQKYLRDYGYDQCEGISDPTLAMKAIALDPPDVVLLDVMMPLTSGLEILTSIRRDPKLMHLPVLVLTASNDKETRLAVLDRGGTDFLSKPIDPLELVPRVRNAVNLKKYQDGLQAYANDLATAVRKRTAELEGSRKDVIYCLARAAEMRDDDTGHHVMRVGKYAAVIAQALGFDPRQVEMLEQAAQLHDIGKIGISDEILLKPSRLEPEQFERMQRHVGFGKKIIQPFAAADWEVIKHHVKVGQRVLEQSHSPLLKLAASIALTHHERWNGEGYPLGLSGEDIPLEGRITAIADVFDALSSRRPYKAPFPIDRCFAIIAEERGQHFDPTLVDLFLQQRQAITAIQLQFADCE